MSKPKLNMIIKYEAWYGRYRMSMQRVDATRGRGWVGTIFHHKLGEAGMPIVYAATRCELMDKLMEIINEKLDKFIKEGVK